MVPLERRLDVPPVVGVEEGQTYEYTAKLTSSIVAGSHVTLRVFSQTQECSVVGERMLVFSDDNATTGAFITVSVEDNDIDEGGAGKVSNRCTLLHVLNSTEKASKYEGRVVALTVRVYNNDVADLALQAGVSGVADKVNTLGPLCLVEGQNVSYWVGLSTRPRANVIVHARLAIPRATSPLMLTVNPSKFTIQPSDGWSSLNRSPFPLPETTSIMILGLRAFAFIIS